MRRRNINRLKDVDKVSVLEAISAVKKRFFDQGSETLNLKRINTR